MREFLFTEGKRKLMNHFVLLWLQIPAARANLRREKDLTTKSMKHTKFEKEIHNFLFFVIFASFVVKLSNTNSRFGCGFAALGSSW